MDRSQAEGPLRISPDLTYVLDSQGRFSLLKGPCEEIIGCPSRELVGRHFTEIICPADANKAQWHFNERRTGPRATRGHQIRLLAKNGSSSHRKGPTITAVRVDASGIWINTDSTGKRRFIGTIGVAKDVRKKRWETARKHKISMSLIGLLDEEKSRIAAELHDHVGQLLVSIKMDLERIKGRLNAVPEIVNEWVETTIGKSVEAIRELREIAYGLKPVALESVDLVCALQNLFNDISDRCGLEIDFFHERVSRELAFPVKLALFRIAQEALTNVIKHSKASHVHVTLLGREKRLMMSVEDNGIGFEAKRMRRTDGRSTLGLLIMEERASQIGGEICIESSIGKGMHLGVEIPL